MTNIVLKDKTGEMVPDVIFKVIENGEWKDISSDDIFAGKTVVVHSLPGAATPTCSTHTYQDTMNLLLLFNRMV